MSLSRASAVLMLLFTDRHYRKIADRVGVRPWPGRSSSLSLILKTLPTVFSLGRAMAIQRRVERDFGRAAFQAAVGHER